jgi:hypothetical protein
MIPKKPALGPRSEGVNRLSDKLKRKAKTKERVNLRPFRFMRACVPALTLTAAIAVGIAVGLGQGTTSCLAQQAAKQSWPPLPTTGFISGRPATDKDVAEGNAVFALRAYGVPFGKPLDVTIPQYAYLTKRGQQPIAVIVVQAELGKGLKIFGVRDLNGKTATAKESELQLLGTHSPD